MTYRLAGLMALATLNLLACSEPASQKAAAPAPPGPVNVVSKAPEPPENTTVIAQAAVPGVEEPAAVPNALVTPAAASVPPAGQAVNDAQFAAKPDPKAEKIGLAVPQLIKLQVLLDRAHFSPGEIDGRDGTNQQVAIAAYEAAHGLPVDGKLDEAVWNALTEADSAPVMQSYTLTAEDVAGPFIASVPKDMQEEAKLPALGYTSPAEALSEKFHMSIGLLTALNPGAAFTAGSVILTVAPHVPLSGVEVVSVEVDRAARTVRALDAEGKLVAAYPASVGSTDMPAPEGTWKVRAVAPRPVYYYDPSRLTFGRTTAKGKLKIAAGPNNPVGSTWIDLTKDTYGIHGTPDPETIGKHQSHGCVRLTNWDAAELGKIIKKGATVAFVGSNTAKRAKAA